MNTNHPANIDIAAALAEAQELYRGRNPKSLAQYREACAAMPGGNTRSAIFVDPFPLTMTRGAGSHLWDLDGHEYVDFLSEFTAGLFGHSHPKIRHAIDEALDSGWNLGAQGAAEARFAAAICDRFPSIELVRFTNSGTEANLMAVAAARALTGRDKILVFAGGYHGGVFYFRGKGSAVNAPFDFLLGEYNDIEGTRALVAPHHADLAAILLEPMLGGSGCIPATREFLADLRALTLQMESTPALPPPPVTTAGSKPLTLIVLVGETFNRNHMSLYGYCRPTTPQLAVVILTAFAEDDLVRRCVRAGARGYLLKDIAHLDLGRNVRAVMRGEAVIDSKVAPTVLAAARHIYQQAGFKLMRSEQHESWGRPVVSEHWDLEL